GVKYGGDYTQKGESYQVGNLYIEKSPGGYWTIDYDTTISGIEVAGGGAALPIEIIGIAVVIVVVLIVVFMLMRRRGEEMPAEVPAPPPEAPPEAPLPEAPPEAPPPPEAPSEGF
ncbi:MAG: hypothetical protein ACK4GQ_03910, partial [Candidatus Hadarchaeales archaeon]